MLDFLFTPAAQLAPAHVVTLTLYVTEKRSGEALQKLTRESFEDSNPSTSVVEAKQLRTVGALVEVEAVAIVRGSRSVK